MDNPSDRMEGTEFRRFFGVFLLVFAAVGGYWIVDVALQLWNTPKSVPLVSFFMELIQEHQESIIKLKNGTEIHLPSSWPMIAGVFLTIVLISSIGLLVRTLLSSGLSLLYPELRKAGRGLLSGLKKPQR